MHTKSALLVGAAFVAGATLTRFIKKDVDLKNFINEALAKGFAEIQSSRLALEKSNSTNVKIFAQRTMDDYNTFNQRLIEIARKKAISVPAIEDYRDAAEPYIIRINNEASFDQQYVNHRLNSHKEMIKLFRLTGRSNDPLLRDFLSHTLAQLDQHLRMAQELAETLHSNTIPTTSPQTTDFVEEPDYKV